VHSNIGAPILCRFDRRPQLGFGEGRRIERAVRRRHSTTRRQLDLRRIKQELRANAHPDLVWAVGDHSGARLFSPGLRVAEGARQFVGLAKVAMTAGDRDDGKG